jgi:hypothetical protein
VELTLPEAQRKLFLFNKGTYQRIQFVHDPEMKNSSTFLFISGEQQHKLDLHRLNTNWNAKTNTWTIAEKNPTVLLTTISSASLWCHWEYTTSTLYHIVRKQQNNSPSTPPKPTPNNFPPNQSQEQTCFLECLQVMHNQAHTIYRYTLPLSLTHGHTAPSVGQCCMFPHDSYLDFQLVRLRNLLGRRCALSATTSSFQTTY